MSTSSRISKPYQNAVEFKYVSLCQSNSRSVRQADSQAAYLSRSANQPVRQPTMLSVR